MYRSAAPINTECVPCKQGMGSIDFSNLTWDNYLLFGIGAMMLYAIISPGASIFTPSAPKPKRRARRVSGKAGFAGGAVTALVLLGGGYLAYSYLTKDGQVAP